MSTSTTSKGAPAALAWNPSTSYPLTVWTQSCVESGGYLYCVGGLTGSNTVTDSTSAVYYAPVSSSGIGSWTNTTAYPTSIRSESCVTESSTVYCVGGYAGSTLSDAVYYARLSSSGVGAWANATAHPLAVWLTACVASSSGIYCVGGGTSSPTLTSTQDVYFAPFSSSGIGQWVSTSSYPVGVKQEACVSSASDIYCVGGYLSTSVYYASLSPTGVGRWTNTTGYPFTVGANLASCVTIGDEVYCVGGHTGSEVSNDVYHAPISASGVGEWVNATSYPVAVWGETCVTSGGYLYCVGGETASGSVLSGVWYSS
jgi:N-acetylneuraminic acid mutarotase